MHTVEQFNHIKLGSFHEDAKNEHICFMCSKNGCASLISRCVVFKKYGKQKYTNPKLSCPIKVSFSTATSVEH